MTTLISDQRRAVADAQVNKCGYSSAVLAGILPDRAHLDKGGYHCSVEDLRRFGNADDYSNTRPDDRNFNIKYNSAHDVSMSRADMMKHHKRVYAVWANKSDPRRRYINAINTWDGSGDAVRLDFVTGKAGYANKSHTWHSHGEGRRRYALDAKAARAEISIYAGESMAAWVAREEKPAVITPVVQPVPAKPAAKPKPSAPARAPGTRELSYVPGRKPLTGADVAFAQRALAKVVGASIVGPADGIAGAKFRAAAKKFQAKSKLTADGIVGRRTWAKLGVKATF